MMLVMSHVAVILPLNYNFFVTEKEFADSLAILTKIGQHIKSTRRIGVKNDLIH